jgi:hypothetical protein
MAREAKHPIDREMRWNFGDSRSTPVSLDDFLAQKEAAGVEFFAGKEPWLVGLHKLNWQTFFRVCTQEMDDLSQKALKLVIEYCLEVLEEVEETIRGKASLAWLEAALNVTKEVVGIRVLLTLLLFGDGIPRRLLRPVSAVKSTSAPVRV